MASFIDSLDPLGSDSPAASTEQFEDGYGRFESFSTFTDSDLVKDVAADDSESFNSHQPIPKSPPIYTSGQDPLEFSSEKNGPILPPPTEMQEEGYALREWRRQNAIRLEEKQKKEKELLSQILEEADEYKVEFIKKRQAACETNKASNREKEKDFLASLEKFHADADKNYWKSIAELIPKEVPTVEKKKSKKDQEKKPSVIMIQGPKPGKPTDLSRMRQILIKLKHETPPHLKPSLPVASTSGKDGKDADVTAAPKPAGVEVSPQPVAVA